MNLSTASINTYAIPANKTMTLCTHLFHNRKTTQRRRDGASGDGASGGGAVAAPMGCQHQHYYDY